jgi:protein-tyrosine phosphatase
MPAVYRETAARWTSYVFSDIDAVPPGIEALRRLVESIVEELRSGTAGPEHLFLMCQHGMNRSGLAAGLVLGELGMPGEEAVERIVTQRPGALSNLAFRTIVLKGVRSKE